MVLTPHKRSSDQRARSMQLDNDTESAESNFAAVLATRERCSRMRSLAGPHCTAKDHDSFAVELLVFGLVMGYLAVTRL